MKKNCTFCGEPLHAGDKECKQCGWDSSKVGHPSASSEDKRAWVGVSLGLLMAFGGMSFLLDNAAAAPSVPLPRSAIVPETQGTVAVDRLVAPEVPSSPVVSAKAPLVSVKVVDAKAASIAPRDALTYKFDLPETDQNCKLIGQLRGSTGAVEVFLMRDDDYMLWQANPAAIPHSAWEPIRGLDVALNYQLADPGSYFLVVSNALSPERKTVQVKAQVKCTRDARPRTE
ncbi:MAG: hypothetical protein ABR585_09560 [Gemmatimonadaceae bacterium]